MTLRTYGHDTPRRHVVKQENYSGLHSAPDQEQGGTYIRFYETVILTNWGRLTRIKHASIPLYAPFSSRITLPWPPSSAVLS